MKDLVRLSIQCNFIVIETSIISIPNIAKKHLYDKTNYVCNNCKNCIKTAITLKEPLTYVQHIYVQPFSLTLQMAVVSTFLQVTFDITSGGNSMSE